VGQPRRISDFTNYDFLAPLMPMQKFVSIAAIATIAVQLLFLINFLYSLKWGKKAEMNPWRATTLEWTVPSPPPHDNFGGHVPVVYRGPYEFSVPGMTEDYLPQHLAPEKMAKS